MSTHTESRPPLAPVARDASAPQEQSRWADTDGLRVHARCWLDTSVAADPPVVLVHGLGVGSRMCQPVARRLAVRHHVYAPDLPGFGDSDKPERALDIDELGDALAAWLRAMGLTGAVLVGVSVGCQVAAAAAAAHPDLCRLLVLGSPTVDQARRTWRSQLWRWQVEQTTQSLRMRGIMALDYAKAGVSRVARTFSAAMDDAIEDRITRVPQPTLVCWATRDPLLRREWAELLVQRAPDARLAILPGAVHNLSHENPVEFSRVITYFVNS